MSMAAAYRRGRPPVGIGPDLLPENSVDARARLGLRADLLIVGAEWRQGWGSN